MVAVDQDGARTQSAQRVPRRLAGLWKVRGVSGEFDGGPQQSGGERIDGQEQNVVTAHGAIGSSSHHHIPVAEGWGPASKHEATPRPPQPTVRS